MTADGPLGFFTNEHFGTVNVLGISQQPAAVVVVSTAILDRPDGGPDVFFGTMAHEFLHMLYTIHFGMIVDNAEIGNGVHPPFKWFDEALAELTSVYWHGEEGRNFTPKRFIDSVGPSYYTDRSVDFAYFLHFNGSEKSYGKSFLHALFITMDGGPAAAGVVFEYLIETFPPAQNEDEFMENIERITEMGMMEIMGNIYHRVGLTPYTGEEAFADVFFRFMEYYAADGGRILTDNGRQTRSFSGLDYSALRLWGIRPGLGTDNPVFASSYADAISLADHEPIPALRSGETVSLRADQMPAYDLDDGTLGDMLSQLSQDEIDFLSGLFSIAAAHEASLGRLFKLERPDGANTLTIRVDDIVTPYTRWYLVSPNDAPGSVSSEANRTFGSSGATLYQITPGIEYSLRTAGQDIYLFGVTLFRNVDAEVNFSWDGYVAGLRRFAVQQDSPVIRDSAGNAYAQMMDVLPIIVQDRILLPIRFIAYALGAEVDWSQATDYRPLTVHLTFEGQTLSFGIGELTPELEALGMDVPAQIADSRTMVPLRFISEFFGAVVTWDGEARTAEIILNAQQP
jgi:hypothetical protein